MQGGRTDLSSTKHTVSEEFSQENENNFREVFSVLSEWNPGLVIQVLELGQGLKDLWLQDKAAEDEWVTEHL